MMIPAATATTERSRRSIRYTTDSLMTIHEIHANHQARGCEGDRRQHHDAGERPAHSESCLSSVMGGSPSNSACTRATKVARTDWALRLGPDSPFSFLMR